MAAPQGMIRRVIIELPHTRDVTQKLSISLALASLMRWLSLKADMVVCRVGICRYIVFRGLIHVLFVFCVPLMTFLINDRRKFSPRTYFKSAGYLSDAVPRNSGGLGL